MQNRTRQNLITLSNTEATLVGPIVVHGGTDLTVQNANDEGYIYLGNEYVSSTFYGFRLLPNTAISFELPAYSTIYASSSIDNMKAAVIMTGLEAGS